jgi:DNA-binding transcriptional regulator YiaG
LIAAFIGLALGVFMALGLLMDSAEALVADVRQARLPRPTERRRIREAAGVSLREIAVALDVAPLTVLRWEQGKVTPRREHAVAYRSLLEGLEEAAR